MLQTAATRRTPTAIMLHLALQIEMGSPTVIPLKIPGANHRCIHLLPAKQTPTNLLPFKIGFMFGSIRWHRLSYIQTEGSEIKLLHFVSP
jgi:hypothetical protein